MNGSIEAFLLLGFVLSVLATVGGVVIIGIVLVRLPSGYFADSAARQFLPGTHPLVRWAAVAVKNLLGAGLVLLGLLMSVPGIPGPGLMSILIGFMLLDFGAKRRWAGWVISRPPILWAANTLRGKYGRPPFVIPPAVNG